MLPKIVYRQAYYDVTNEYYAGKLTTEEWIAKWKEIFASFYQEYGENAILGLGEKEQTK